MANRTAKDARSIKGTNPQYLVEKIIRTRIYDCKYWKEECFGLTAELLVDCAMELDHLGGVYGGNVQPTPFICLILKMLQIQPTKDIIIEFIKNPDYKYVRVLGALYLRLVGETMECYNYLEPLYNDYRKLKRKNRNGEIELIHVDEFMDELLHDERVCDIILPRIQKRYILEQNEQLEPRVSALDDDLSDDLESEEEEEEEERDTTTRLSHRRRHSPSPAHYRHHDRDRERRHRSHSKSPARRRRSRSPRGQRHSPPREDRERRRGRSRSRSHSPRRHHSPSKDSRTHRRDRKRSRSRSRSPTSHHHHHHSSSKHTFDKKSEKSRSSDKTKEKSSKAEKRSKEGKTKKKMVTSSGKELSTEQAQEIRQANELRAKLGMKPLQV